MQWSSPTVRRDIARNTTFTRRFAKTQYTPKKRMWGPGSADDCERPFAAGSHSTAYPSCGIRLVRALEIVQSSIWNLNHHEPIFIRRPGKKEEPGSALVRLAAHARLFRSDDGIYYASVPVGGRQEIVALRSPAFRDWLVDAYVNEQGETPPRSALGQVTLPLEARARYEPSDAPIFIRVGRESDSNGNAASPGASKGQGAGWLIDLGNPSGRAIGIEADGWSVIEQPGIHFRRPAGMMAFPSPARDGAIELLRPYVNLSGPDFQLLVAWLASALQPVGPYPILALHGEQGTAKSTLAKIIRLLIDPQSAPLLAVPGGNRDLMVSAYNGWLLAFDNISSIPHWLSDGLCRLSTGGGFATRSLYRDQARTVINAQRPVILNGIEECVRRGDLADRTVFLNLPPIAAATRLTEQAFWASFHQYYPRILGGLFDAVAGGLRTLPSIELAEIPRMADFARLGEAVGRGLGWPAGSFLAAYNDNRRHATMAPIDESLVAHALLHLIGPVVTEWTGSPTTLLDALSKIVGKKHAASALWPKNATKLGNELRRIAPQLRIHGLAVDFARTHKGRTIRLKHEPSPIPATRRA